MSTQWRRTITTTDNKLINVCRFSKGRYHVCDANGTLPGMILNWEETCAYAAIMRVSLFSEYGNAHATVTKKTAVAK